MYLQLTTVLPTLLLVLLAAAFQDDKATAQQTPRSDNQSAAQLADVTVQTFHRGSGRRQLFWESIPSEL